MSDDIHRFRGRALALAGAAIAIAAIVANFVHSGRILWGGFVVVVLALVVVRRQRP